MGYIPFRKCTRVTRSLIHIRKCTRTHCAIYIANNHVSLHEYSDYPSNAPAPPIPGIGRIYPIPRRGTSPSIRVVLLRNKWCGQNRSTLLLVTRTALERKFIRSSVGPGLVLTEHMSCLSGPRAFRPHRNLNTPRPMSRENRKHLAHSETRGTQRRRGVPPKGNEGFENYEIQAP